MALKIANLQICAVVFTFLSALVPWVHLAAKQAWNMTGRTHPIESSIFYTYLILLNLSQLITVIAMFDAIRTKEELAHDTHPHGRDSEASITSTKVAHSLTSDPWSVLTIGRRGMTQKGNESFIDTDPCTDLLRDLALQHRQRILHFQRLAPMDRFMYGGKHPALASGIKLDDMRGIDDIGAVDDMGGVLPGSSDSRYNTLRT